MQTQTVSLSQDQTELLSYIDYDKIIWSSYKDSRGSLKIFKV